MSVVNAVSDIFLGSPFSTPVGILVEEATEDFVGAELWPLFSQVCKAINQSTTGPKDAIRAIRRRFVSSACTNEISALHCLLLLETCVNNCGYRFSVVLANRDTLKDISRFAYPDVAGVSNTVRDKLLSLVQQWAQQHGRHVDLQEFTNIYTEMKARGVKFLDIANPATPSLGANTPARAEQSSTVQPEQLQINGDVVRQSNPTSQDQRSASDALSSSKLSVDLAQVRVNVCVLSDLITETENESSPNTEALSLMADITKALQEMSQRIIYAISSWETFQESLPSRGTSDAVLLDLINVNDEVHTVLVRHERFSRAQPTPLSTGNAPPTTVPITDASHVDPTTAIDSFVGDPAPSDHASILDQSEPVGDSDTVSLLAPAGLHTRTTPDDPKDTALIDF